MQPERISIEREIRDARGAHGTFLLGDVEKLLPELCERYEGSVKLIYLDPPYLTGDRFYMRVPVGSEQWKNGRSGIRMETFTDRCERTEFLRFMREVLTACRRLLRDDGMLFLHIDYRTNAHMRLLLDEIFGESNFVNEIIWAYQTGGRSKRFFSRKHDTIFFYRKTDKYDFDISKVMVVPEAPKSNHMRRHVDPDGRVYRSIRSGGRVYTYYDDDPVAPPDVWTDLSHLQQRDPERTGYDTQKPLSLLNRIVLCGSREGDLVMDLFAGSGTTLEAAQRSGRRFVGVDQCRLVMNILRRRLFRGTLTLEAPGCAGEPVCELSEAMGIGFRQLTLERFETEAGVLPEGTEISGLDAVESWSVGYVREDGYHVMAESLRSRRTPSLQTMLELPVFAGTPAVCVNDITGRSFYYALDNSMFKQNS